MVAVRINGEEAALKSDGLPRMADVVELIKSTIDPDQMITGLNIDGREFEEKDWGSSPTQYGTSIIEVETGTPSDYVADRITKSPLIIRACFDEFKTAREMFQEGKSQEANASLKEAVGTLLAFCEWYASILEIVPESQRDNFDIEEEMEQHVEICKQICQQQLYQSWWALGQTIEKDLEPALEKLEARLKSFGAQFEV